MFFELYQDGFDFTSSHKVDTVVDAIRKRQRFEIDHRRINITSDTNAHRIESDEIKEFLEGSNTKTRLSTSNIDVSQKLKTESICEWDTPASECAVSPGRIAEALVGSKDEYSNLIGRMMVFLLKHHLGSLC